MRGRREREEGFATLSSREAGGSSGGGGGLQRLGSRPAEFHTSSAPSETVCAGSCRRHDRTRRQHSVCVLHVVPLALKRPDTLLA
eukprot:21894-Chlamydomonas_euryale.AAC.3